MNSLYQMPIEFNSNLNYWWVNQNKTFEEEVGGGYLWSPQLKKNGMKNPFYDFMLQVRPGDVVFSYAQQQISAVGIVTSPASPAGNPFTEQVGALWNEDGWYVEVAFVKLESRVSPKDYWSTLSSLLGEKYTPLTQEGRGKEFYLTALNRMFAEQLFAIVASQNLPLVSALKVIDPQTELDSWTDREVAAAIGADVPETEQVQLSKARRGQGLFKARVANLNPMCRVTGVSEGRLLRASHIKPWKDSSNAERLDGANGLLLSPHIDLLFDKGLLTFLPSGELQIAEALPKYVIDAWHLHDVRDSKAFRREQWPYLEHHNSVIYPQGQERWARPRRG